VDNDEYLRWWIDNTDDAGELRADLPEPVATLAAHVVALQDRIGRLPAPGEVVDLTRHQWVTSCACAYDHPDAVCMAHRAGGGGTDE
jgi:hypothetical protein